MMFPKLQERRCKSQAWPDARDYCEAIVDPNAIGDSALRGAPLDRCPSGPVRTFSGGFTTTFHFESVGGGQALRCFTRCYDDLERRYAAISELLRYVRSGALCRAQYMAEGIRVRGTWWPAVKMDWIAGRALNAEIEARCDDGDAILALARSFREMVHSLEVFGVAHGDLQHGNILVKHGRLHLIDYDGMFLPALADLTQTEYGHRNYQHPQRRQACFDSRLDRFSSIVIYTALVALSADRTLWPRFNDGENVLFRAHDFTSNGQSDLFRTLLVNNASSGLAGVLLAACHMPVEDVPTLEQAIESVAGTMPAVSSVPVGAGSRGRFELRPLPPARPSRPAPGNESPVPASQSERQSSPSASREPVRLPRFVRVWGVVAIGLAAMAAGFAMTDRPHGAALRIASQANRAAVAAAKPAPRLLRALAASAKFSAVPAKFAAAASKATAAPMAAVMPAIAANTAALRGAWQLQEANVQNGTMVWSGDAAVANRGTLVLNVHKDSVAGRPATPCERRTQLHAAVALGVGPQIVPFQEINCEGATLSGEVRVASFAHDERSFYGTFWQGGIKLGDFTAAKW